VREGAEGFSVCHLRPEEKTVRRRGLSRQGIDWQQKDL
jgi:hypothetical protein